jgi:hypothetical protein
MDLNRDRAPINSELIGALSLFKRHSTGGAGNENFSILKAQGAAQYGLPT